MALNQGKIKDKQDQPKYPFKGQDWLSNKCLWTSDQSELVWSGHLFRHFFNGT